MAESKTVHVSKVELPDLKRGVIRMEFGETSQGGNQLVISVEEAQTQSGLVQPRGREERFNMFEDQKENVVPISSARNSIKTYERDDDDRRREIVLSMDEVQMQTRSRAERFREFESYQDYQEAQTQIGLRRKDRFKTSENEVIPTKSKTPKVQKATFHLRDHEHFVKYYEPRLVSFGPIHHGKEKYRLAESFKLTLANLFVESSGKGIEEIFKAIEGKIKELRDCFEEEVNEKYKNDVDLAWILFVDGCAILQYIYLAVVNKFRDLNIKPDSVAFCQQDLFLLENQVPYCLLEVLMSLSQMKENLQISIDEFIRRNKNMVLMHQQSSQLEQAGGSRESERPTHLLDLLRTSLLGLARKPKKGEQRPRMHKDKQKNDPGWQSYRSVQELKAAGIHVKRSEDNSLRGISFTRKYNIYPGILSIPLLIVDDSTGPMFLNLIAYEKCPDFDNDFGITSYVSFLDSLIDEANDVKELRKASVLLNLLGSNEKVAQLFNEIGTDLVPNAGLHAYVLWQIQKYFYDNRIVIWTVELFQDLSGRPWKIVAFLGSLSALVLTAIQTFHTPSGGPCEDLL